MSDLEAIKARLEAIEARLGCQVRRTIDPDAVYLPAEVAEILRVGKSSVYDLAGKGLIGSIRVGAGGGGLRIRGSDLLSFLESRKEGPEPRMNFKRLGL